MKTLGAYEKCKQYIECHTTHADELSRRIKKTGNFPAITISRQTGAGAAMVGEKLIDILSKYKTDNSCEWAYFDKELINKVLLDYNLPEKFEKFFTEDKYSNFEAIIKDFLWIDETSWSLFQKTTKTIIKLAQMGNVIIVGRGSNIITSKFKNVFHVRLVAPYDARLRHIREYFNMEEKEARDYIKKEESARKNYLRSYFYKDIDDPSLYHVVINTHLVGYEEAAELIVKSIIKRFPKIYSEMATVY